MPKLKTNRAAAKRYSFTATGKVKRTKAEAGIANQENSDANEYVCIDLSNATHPVSPCEANDGTEYTGDIDNIIEQALGE